MEKSHEEATRGSISKSGPDLAARAVGLTAPYVGWLTSSHNTSLANLYELVIAHDSKYPRYHLADFNGPAYIANELQFALGTVFLRKGR